MWNQHSFMIFRKCITIILFWQSYDFLSFRFPKEDSRFPTFLVVAFPLYGDATCSPVPSPSQRIYSSRFTSLVGYQYSVNKRRDVQIVRWRESLHLPADRPVCQNNMTHRPPRARSRAGLLCATLYNKWMYRSLLFANCLPLIY